jgi:hypothetical protein
MGCYRRFSFPCNFPRFLKALSVERMFQRFLAHIYLLLVMRGNWLANTVCGLKIWADSGLTLYNTEIYISGTHRVFPIVTKSGTFRKCPVTSSISPEHRHVYASFSLGPN